jgi:hypothetical protein
MQHRREDTMRRVRMIHLLTLFTVFILATPGSAQIVASGAGSSVGYIDPALPMNQLRLRYDSAYDNRRPNRAEFFYARGAPLGPGLPLPEKSVDYQEVMGLIEYAPDEMTSVFVEFPCRFLNPEVNADHAGFGDMNAGLKRVLLGCPAESALTFQFRTWIPTGDAGKGLGNDHVSLEPALLFCQKVDECLTVEGELRYWIPIDGTDFAGDIVRYGIGASYLMMNSGCLQVRPVVEVVGWTVMDGAQTVVSPFNVATIEDAAGDTIVNAKVGVRATMNGSIDLYAGYGRPLTGDRWYDNVLRFELRLRF